VAVAAEELDAARRWGAPTTIGTSLAALGFAQGGPEGLATLAEAAELLAGTEGRLAHVEALVDLGAALRRAGRRADARAVLADAHGRAVALGLPRLARLADAELAATGARARSVLRSGADALTPSERRVADLAAAGRTNREIAALLFVSQKTVEFHLRNAFRTLGVRSRDALAEALRR
jgi:DNA-binding CsgD family transcriptional regulator